MYKIIENKLLEINELGKQLACLAPGIKSWRVCEKGVILP